MTLEGQTENPTHWAIVTWYGINELAATPFHEVLSGSSPEALYRQCHVWAYGNLSPDANYEVHYAGKGMADQRENDPRKNIPLSTEHEMTPRQRACFEEAERARDVDKGSDQAASREWCNTHSKG